jgi:hypothetical protein
MHIPEPVFDLVLAYVTDGDPARRVLDHFDRGRPVAGWRPDEGTWRARRALCDPGRDWGAVRRLMDTVVYLAGGACRRIDHKIVLAYCGPPRTVLQCLLGSWRAPVGVAQPVRAVTDAHRFPALMYDGRPGCRGFLVSLRLASALLLTPPLSHLGNYTLFIMQECVKTPMDSLLLAQFMARRLNAHDNNSQRRVFVI